MFREQFATHRHQAAEGAARDSRAAPPEAKLHCEQLDAKGARQLQLTMATAESENPRQGMLF